MRRVVWSFAALVDIARIRNYITDFNPAAAQELADRLIDIGSKLSAFSYSGRPASANLREITLIHPYIIRYRIVGDEVRIVRVRHGRRRR